MMYSDTCGDLIVSYKSSVICTINVNFGACLNMYQFVIKKHSIFP